MTSSLQEHDVTVLVVGYFKLCMSEDVTTMPPSPAGDHLTDLLTSSSGETMTSSENYWWDLSQFPWYGWLIVIAALLTVLVLLGIVAVIIRWHRSNLPCRGWHRLLWLSVFF